MKKLITMLSTLTITSSIAPSSIVCTKNKIHEIGDEVVKITYKNFNERCYYQLASQLMKEIEEDCSKNFQNYFHSKHPKFKLLPWKDVIKEFESYLYKEHFDIEFKIEIENDERDDILKYGINSKKIYISPFKVNKNWELSCSKLNLIIEI